MFEKVLALIGLQNHLPLLYIIILLGQQKLIGTIERLILGKNQQYIYFQ